ncbi:MAG TPA: TIGR03086 family metal-binding protein [Ilumatobacteraceae bacterium]|nr:TIGR03086 family metal-binding protein [Ilumatobacteraceae bacterium]
MAVEPVEMFERAALAASRLAQSVRPDQMGLATPCSEWDVAALLEHMAGGPTYLLGALGIGDADVGVWPEPAAVDAVVARLREPGALDRRCMSPAGFEWSVAEAAAGTAMDQMIHTWDLAVALDTDRELNPEVADAVVSMFLPQMPEVGRQAGFVGPAVEVAEGASPQDVLLGAMGRDPRR